MIIKTQKQLEELMEEASKAPSVGLDTEFVWERTFYPQLGLIQLSIGEDCYLIDPVFIKDLSPLGKLISNPNVVKILHDAHQDLAIIKASAGGSPCNIFDTKIAYGFCSPEATLSLAKLLENLVGVNLDKSETRTNWIKRPLTIKQIEYAYDDVRYLCELMDIIKKSIIENGTESWMLEEMKAYEDPQSYIEPDISEYFRKIRGVGRYSGKNLALFQTLATWREQVARIEDRPRGHVLKNELLFEITTLAPSSIDQLRTINRFQMRDIRQYGAKIIELVQEGLNRPDHLCPFISKPSYNKKDLKEKADVIIDAIHQKAIKLNIDPSLIGSRKNINSYIILDGNDDPDHKMLRGWRSEFMTELVNL